MRVYSIVLWTHICKGDSHCWESAVLHGESSRLRVLPGVTSFEVTAGTGIQALGMRLSRGYGHLACGMASQSHGV